MGKKVLVGLLLVCVGYALNGFVQSFLYEQTKKSYENSLFPRIKSLESIGDVKCTPMFIYHSDSQLLLYCDGLNVEDSSLREALRKSVRGELELWAADNQVADRFLYVSFTDEIPARGKK